MQIGFRRGCAISSVPLPCSYVLTSPLGSPFCVFCPLQVASCCCTLQVASCKLLEARKKYLYMCEWRLWPKVWPRLICLRFLAYCLCFSFFFYFVWMLRGLLNKCSKLYGDKCQESRRARDGRKSRRGEDILAWAGDQCVWGFFRGFKSVVNL